VQDACHAPAAPQQYGHDVPLEARRREIEFADPGIQIAVLDDVDEIDAAHEEVARRGYGERLGRARNNEFCG
jgi:hypothetical protein